MSHFDVLYFFQVELKLIQAIELSIMQLFIYFLSPVFFFAVSNLFDALITLSCLAVLTFNRRFFHWIQTFHVQATTLTSQRAVYSCSLLFYYIFLHSKLISFVSRTLVCIHAKYTWSAASRRTQHKKKSPTDSFNSWLLTVSRRCFFRAQIKDFQWKKNNTQPSWNGEKKRMLSGSKR